MNSIRFNAAAFVRILLIYVLLAAVWIALGALGSTFEMPDSTVAASIGLTLIVSTAIHFGLKHQPFAKWILLMVGLLGLYALSYYFLGSWLMQLVQSYPAYMMVNVLVSSMVISLLLWKIYALDYFWPLVWGIAVASAISTLLFQRAGLWLTDVPGVPLQVMIIAVFQGLRLIPMALGVTVTKPEETDFSTIED